MNLEYPTIYIDRKGTEHSTFFTNGENLKIILRGVEFEGHFWELYPVNNQNPELKFLFDLDEFEYSNKEIGHSLNDFQLNVRIPIKVISNSNIEQDAFIEFQNRPLKLNCIIAGKSYEFEKPNFEYGLSSEFTKSFNIKYVKCCINCKYSEYSPYGNQEYGDMLCFKKCKEAWSKIGYTGLKEPENWDKLKSRITTQEAYWCEEFKLKD